MLLRTTGRVREVGGQEFAKQHSVKQSHANSNFEVTEEISAATGDVNCKHNLLSRHAVILDWSEWKVS